MQDHLLSVVVITYNEEGQIRDCIESVLPVADEIIVLDSFSQDQTASICAEYPILRFSQQAFAGYSPQKNAANALARGKYILSLDADERLSPELCRKLQALKAEGFEAHAYTMPILNNYLGSWIRHGNWYPGRKLRLFLREYGSWQGHIHEHIGFSIAEPQVVDLRGDILHYSYRTVEEHISQFNRFSTMVAEDLQAKGKRASWRHLLINPSWHFLRAYIFRRGFLDGYKGFLIALISAFASFAKYAKLREYNKQAAHEEDTPQQNR